MKEARQRSQQERTAETTQALLRAARELFMSSGYAETATPDIAARAGATRGALYHHFADKRALFKAVVEAESAAVAREIEHASPTSKDPLHDLLAGGDAFLVAMQAPGRTRLLLLEAPAVLGINELATIEARHGRQTLEEGLRAAIAAGVIPPLPIPATSRILAAAFDRAALALAEGVTLEDCRAVLHALMRGLQSNRV